jgi:hypothetical protein
MLANRDRLTLPLDSHGYLRAVVFGLADQVDAAAERQREADARVGKHLRDGSEKSSPQRGETKLEAQLTWITQMVGCGAFTEKQAEAERAKAREKYGNA